MKLVNAEEVRQIFDYEVAQGATDLFDAFDSAIENATAVDAVEVVRCENCQYWNPRYETMGMCMKHNSIVTFAKPDFFCAWGKDKNNGFCKED